MASVLSIRYSRIDGGRFLHGISVTEDPDRRTDKIDRHIDQVRMASGDEDLVDFVADAVESRRENAEGGNLCADFPARQAGICPKEKCAQDGVSEQMQVLVEERDIGFVERRRKGGLHEYHKAVCSKREPVLDEIGQ